MPSNEAVGNAIFSVLSEYHGAHGIENVPISVDKLRDIVRRRCELKTLIWHEVAVDTPNVYGYVKFYYPVPDDVRTNEEPTTAIIRFKETLNFCWKRFVICKELCHCLIDTAEDRITRIVHLKKLLQELASKIEHPGGDGAFASEQLAEIMAVEILFPYELRIRHLEDLRVGKIEPYSLALRYRIPREIAEIGMYDGYLEAVSDIRKDRVMI